MQGTKKHTSALGHRAAVERRGHRKHGLRLHPQRLEGTWAIKILRELGRLLERF